MLYVAKNVGANLCVRPVLINTKISKYLKRRVRTSRYPYINLKNFVGASLVVAQLIRLFPITAKQSGS